MAARHSREGPDDHRDDLLRILLPEAEEKLAGEECAKERRRHPPLLPGKGCVHGIDPEPVRLARDRARRDHEEGHGYLFDERGT